MRFRALRENKSRKSPKISHYPTDVLSVRCNVNRMGAWRCSIWLSIKFFVSFMNMFWCVCIQSRDIQYPIAPRVSQLNTLPRSRVGNILVMSPAIRMETCAAPVTVCLGVMGRVFCYHLWNLFREKLLKHSAQGIGIDGLIWEKIVSLDTLSCLFFFFFTCPIGI